ncbi:MAG: carboxymuconolactone decarboxylase family protein [Planctomycetota bacterium]|nr:carboxymuconolactone decarboxylase family protein [Planctomycetota bacterium]
MTQDPQPTRPPIDTRPPGTFHEFVDRFPTLGKAWDLLHQAGDQGPLDDKTRRLVKLALSIGAMREGAVHSAVRKAVAAGCSRQEVEQVVALAASTVGMPATVAVWTWVRDVFEPGEA